MLQHCRPPHFFATKDGVTWCTRCLAQAPSESRFKLGIHCAPAATGQEPAPPAGGAGIPPPSPAPPPPKRQRMKPHEVDVMLQTHALELTDGYLKCNTCLKRRRTRERAQLGFCQGPPLPRARRAAAAGAPGGAV